MKRKNRKKLAAVTTGLPELTPIRQRQPNGQHRDRADAPRDAKKQALQARVAIFGGQDSKDSRKALESPMYGCQMGMVIARRADRRDVADLWRVFADWCVAEYAYRRRYLGLTEYAKSASLVMVPEPIEADVSHTIDIRTQDERDRATVATWMRWQGYIGCLSGIDQMLLHDARLERAELWADQQPTKRGLSALSSLRDLAAVVK